MPTARKYSSGKSFTMHTPVHPHGTDPSLSNKLQGQPAPLRQTYEFTWINKGNGAGQNGRMGGTITGATAEITCTQANVTPGTHVIRIGPYELRPSVDFAVGANDNALADNLAAAISALPGFSAPNPVANVIAISTTRGNGNDTRIEVLEWGAASAFALTATDREGFMDRGAPAPTAPSIT